MLQFGGGTTAESEPYPLRPHRLGPQSGRPLPRPVPSTARARAMAWTRPQKGDFAVKKWSAPERARAHGLRAPPAGAASGPRACRRPPRLSRVVPPPFSRFANQSATSPVTLSSAGVSGCQLLPICFSVRVVKWVLTGFWWESGRLSRTDTLSVSRVGRSAPWSLQRALF